MKPPARSLRRSVVAAVNAVLASMDLRIVRKSWHQAFLDSQGSPEEPSVETTVPDEARAVLRRDHPRLEELRRRYRGHPATQASLWTESYVRRALELTCFRGDNAYVWQLREGMGEVNYLLTAYYVKSVDRLGLLNRLREDGLFGCQTFPFERGAVISRDLLDSILEIHFLDECLGLSKKDTTVLDIGAGYGRFAVRLSEALPGVKAIFCADAVPESTFLCEFYLRFRQVDHVARAVPLPDLKGLLRTHHIDLATNIHSFTECPLGSTLWWVDQLAESGVRYLFVVPSTREPLLSLETDGRRLDLMEPLRSRGFELRKKQPKYGAPGVQRHGVFPTYYYLFERRH